AQPLPCPSLSVSTCATRGRSRPDGPDPRVSGSIMAGPQLRAQRTVTAPLARVDRYEIIDKLGRGGMGTLYLARDPAIERLVAIKLLRDEFDNDELRERFAREARSAGKLRHPNVVTIFDVGEDAGRPFIAMEYIPGETLAEIIRRREPMSLGRKLQMIEDIC